MLDEILPVNPRTNLENEYLHALLNATMLNGTTPLMFAVSQGHAAAAQLLISRGSSVHVEDKVQDE